MPVTTTWTNPSAAGALDLATGAVINETWVDAMASNFLYIGGSGGIVVSAQSAASLGGGGSTTSASFVNIPSMTLTTTTTGGLVLALFTASCQNTNSTTNDFGLAVDGTNQGPIDRFNSISLNSDYPVHFHWTVTPSAASHTFTVQWKTAAGTLAADSASYMYFTIIEFRR